MVKILNEKFINQSDIDMNVSHFVMNHLNAWYFKNDTDLQKSY